MAGTTIQLKIDKMAESVSRNWDTWKKGRQPWENETQELRNYVFATDARTTSAGESEESNWSNTTHVPKITQIYDNLKANYMSALFPHDDWLTWEGGDDEAETKEKRQAILTYMKNKLREDTFYTTVSKLIDDYVLYGNVFADAEFVRESKTDPLTKEPIAGYIGPRAIRTSPYDISFNPIAGKFKDSPKITRTLYDLGEFKSFLASRPEDSGWIKEVLEDLDEVRRNAVGLREDDFNKTHSIEVDGFGNYWQYMNSMINQVEVLELEGDIYDPDTDTFLQDHIVTVVDRIKVVRKEANPSWLGKGAAVHVGWRERPDNLWAMSPLANVVGLQYRINKIENGKSDLLDLSLTPIVKVVGEVEDFNWLPGEQIMTDENGDVGIISPDLSAMGSNQEISYLMDLMELFTGAPREAMGIRSPGEKTAFEVDQLVTAASRIFQEKIRNFEINLLEPLLNSMLEVASRNFVGSDLVRVLDDDQGVTQFLSITKEDITASGRLRPVGARHFARQSQLMQNIVGISNTPLWQVVQPHLSRTKLAEVVESLLGLEEFNLYGENIGLMEDAASMQAAQSAQQEIAQATGGPDGQEVEQGVDPAGGQGAPIVGP